MKAGFEVKKITPPLGTHMLGFSDRDIAKGCEAIRDDLFVRALYLDHEGEAALIVAYDLLFFSRREADRFKESIGKRLRLAPSRILINFSHTHNGPAMGTWGFAGHKGLEDPAYVGKVEEATLAAADGARASAREASVLAGMTRNTLPFSRRFINAEGHAEWRPAPGAEICDALPICLLQDNAGKPICLLFSVSCHPSTVGGWTISAEYPGVATSLLDRLTGSRTSMFLQGCGGDTKAFVVADGPPDGTGRPTWRRGNWENVDRCGRLIADGVIAALGKGLRAFDPCICTHLHEMHWPLCPPPALETLRADISGTDELRRLWADRLRKRLERGEEPDSTAPVLLQTVQIAEGVRLVALEGEPVAGFGNMILRAFPDGVTFPLGYSNGEGFYLPTEHMLPEGGYEVTCYYEYGLPARLAPGYENIFRQALGQSRATSGGI